MILGEQLGLSEDQKKEIGEAKRKFWIYVGKHADLFLTEWVKSKENLKIEIDTIVDNKADKNEKA